MMEFTFEGIVRHGFGFYNPNHAAALICALFPFLWAAWLKWKHPVARTAAALLMILLLTALMMTFSRTGILVLLLEALLFAGGQKKIHWNYLILFSGLFLLLLLISGVPTRFSIDRAITNRPQIWMAGIALFSQNPFGVGGGNSGLLATTFLLPDGITCRTLVNSHLTLLTEYGFPLAFLWFGFLFYAVFRGWKYPALLSSLTGLAVSSCAASVFDWEVLFDFSGFGSLPASNFILSWLTFLLYAGLIIAICIKSGFRGKSAALSFGTSAALLLLLFLYGSGRANVPEVRGEFIVKKGTEMPLVLYDDRWRLKEVLAFLPDGYFLPLRSHENRADVPNASFLKSKTIFLFGKCCSFSKYYQNRPDIRLIFVSPPDHALFPEHTEKIYLKRYEEENKFDGELPGEIKTEFY